jgi:hypothetical protein
MGVSRTYSAGSGQVSGDDDDDDDRWREVFFALVKRANIDEEFRARVEATGAVIANFEAVLAATRTSHALPTGSIACREYWWGFQLELPHDVLGSWAKGLVGSDQVATAIGPGVGPSAPFRRRIAQWITSRLPDLAQMDRGAGVYACMTWMAPNIFVPIAIPPATTP